MKKIIPALQDGQVIHIFPDNYGTLRFRKLMREMGCDKDIIVGGWSSAPYGSRIDQEGTAMLSGTQINYRAVTLRGAALPTADTELFLESIKFLAAMDSVRLGDGPVAADTVLDTGFSNVNPILHCPGVILGCGALENFGVRYGTTKKDFSIYCHVYSPTVSQVQYTVYCEEKAVAEACGVGIQPFEKEEFFSRSNILGPEYMGYDIHVPFDEEYPMAIGTGPFSVDSRYMTEDLPVGCHVYHELGKKFGVETPLIDSMINFGNAMLPQHNFWEEGVTLEDLGIGHMTKEQMLDYLHNGNYVEA
jgi:opine dehydrogenase